MKQTQIICMLMLIQTCFCAPVQITINNHNSMSVAQATVQPPTTTHVPEGSGWLRSVHLPTPTVLQTGACMIALAAGYELWQIIQSYYMITNSESWCAWHAEIPLAALAQLPRTQLVAELANAISLKYTNKAQAWYLFFQDIEKEQTHIRHTLWLLQKIESLAVVHLLYDLTALIEAHTNALERIAFLQILLHKEVLHGTQNPSSVAST